MASKGIADDTQQGAPGGAAADAVILFDADGIILMVNPACQRLFGFGAGEAVGQSLTLLLPPPATADRSDANWREGAMREGGTTSEALGRRRDGSTFPVRLWVGAARHDGRPIYTAVMQDLSEGRRTEQALLDSAARLRAVVDTAVDGVILIDARGRIMMFNPACESLFGYSADEVVGENVTILMPEPQRSEHDAYLDRYHATGQRKIIGIGREVLGQRKDGTTFSLRLAVGEARHEGESTFVGIIHDLTDTKRSEDQLLRAQKMEAIGNLSGGIAHDFNNLLLVIIGNADDLSEQLKARPDLRRLADAVVDAANRGAELTRRLLAFGRRQMLQPVELDCNRLIHSMLALLKRTVQADIDIQTSLEPALWLLFVDPGQLEAALLNLTLNARDAMPEGGTLTISTDNVPLDANYRDLHPEVRPGRYVMIQVTDTGTGMAPEVLRHVFEPFFTTKEVGKGSGLGLSMVYGFVKQSGGHVGVYSEEGLGTTVRLYLPASGSGAVVEPTEAAAEPLRMARGERVLVAEDDAFVSAYVVSALQALGYRVIAVANGHEALACLQSDEIIDVLFTDIVMPGGISGWELAAKAIELRPALKVLVTSGYALETLASRGLIRPDIDFMTKPFRKVELARRLREAIDRENGRGV